MRRAYTTLPASPAETNVFPHTHTHTNGRGKKAHTRYNVKTVNVYKEKCVRLTRPKHTRSRIHARNADDEFGIFFSPVLFLFHRVRARARARRSHARNPEGDENNIYRAVYH